MTLIHCSHWFEIFKHGWKEHRTVYEIGIQHKKFNTEKMNAVQLLHVINIV